MVSEAHHRAFEEDGFFIVDDAIDPALLEPMREAAARIKDRVRSGEVDVFTQWAEPGEPFNILWHALSRLRRARLLRLPALSAADGRRDRADRLRLALGVAVSVHQSLPRRLPPGLAPGPGRRAAGPAHSGGARILAPAAGGVPLGAGAGRRRRPQGGAGQSLPPPHPARHRRHHERQRRGFTRPAPSWRRLPMP